MYSVLVIEDDPVQVSIICDAFEQMCKGNNEFFDVQSVSSAEAFCDRGLNTQAFDMVIADVELKNSSLDGIEFVKQYFPAESGSQVIFITAHIEYCTKVYEVNHIYFLVKPFVYADFVSAIAKAQHMLEKAQRGLFSFKAGGKIVSLPVDHIEYLESHRRKVCIYSDGEHHETYASLKNLAPKLPRTFLRCHNSFLVNMRHIARMNIGTIELRSGAKIPISQSRRKSSKEQFAEFLRVN